MENSQSLGVLQASGSHNPFSLSLVGFYREGSDGDRQPGLSLLIILAPYFIFPLSSKCLLFKQLQQEHQEKQFINQPKNRQQQQQQQHPKIPKTNEIRDAIKMKSYIWEGNQPQTIHDNGQAYDSPKGGYLKNNICISPLRIS